MLLIFLDCLDGKIYGSIEVILMGGVLDSVIFWRRACSHKAGSPNSSLEIITKKKYDEATDS